MHHRGASGQELGKQNGRNLETRKEICLASLSDLLFRIGALRLLNQQGKGGFTETVH